MYVMSVAYSPNGKTIVSGGWDKKIILWDAQTARQIGAPLEGHEGGVSCVRYSFDGKSIISGSEDKTVRIWDAVTGNQLH